MNVLWCLALVSIVRYARICFMSEEYGKVSSVAVSVSIFLISSSSILWFVPSTVLVENAGEVERAVSARARG